MDGDSLLDGSEVFEHCLIPPISPLPPIPLGKKHPGCFGINRHEHVHTGVDLYAPMGCPVSAMETGKVIQISWFTGPVLNLPWWRNTKAGYIEGRSGVFIYGEIQEYPSLKVGDTVQRGEYFGYVLPVLKKYKGIPMSMLHIELYEQGYTDNWVEWKIGEEKPEHLKDPTPYLLTIIDSKSTAIDLYADSNADFVKRGYVPDSTINTPSFCEKTWCSLNNGGGTCMEGLCPEYCHSTQHFFDTSKGCPACHTVGKIGQKHTDTIICHFCEHEFPGKIAE